jgi:nitronate monooxygenase
MIVSVLTLGTRNGGMYTRSNDDQLLIKCQHDFQLYSRCTPCHKGRFERATCHSLSRRPARGIVNRFMTEVERAEAPEAILPFPLQNALTRPLRNAAARQGRIDYLSLWAGQGVRLARRQPAATLIARLAHEAEAVVRRLARSD